MKILYFTTFDLRLAKGPSINEREFIGQLFRQDGIKVRAIAPYSALFIDDLPREKIHPIMHAWGPSIDGVLSSERELSEALCFEMGSFKPDIVVGRLSLLPFGSINALRYYDTPFAIKSLGSAGFVPSGWSLTQVAIRILRPVIRTLLRRAVCRSCMIDTTTDKLRSLIIRETRANPDSVHIVPNATNTQRFMPADSSELRMSLGISHEGVVIGYTGGDPVQRGGREVVQVVKRLQDRGVDANGVIVGDRRYELIKLSQSMMISERIHMPGKVKYDEMPRWINLIDIGIAIDNSARAKQVGNSYQKVRQFVSCGRFIVTHIDDSDDVVAQCPLVSHIHDTNIENIYQSIHNILSLSQKERESRQEKGRVFAQEYLSLETSLSVRLRLWESCIQTD